MASAFFMRSFQPSIAIDRMPSDLVENTVLHYAQRIHHTPRYSQTRNNGRCYHAYEYNYERRN